MGISTETNYYILSFPPLLVDDIIPLNQLSSHAAQLPVTSYECPHQIPHLTRNNLTHIVGRRNLRRQDHTLHRLRPARTSQRTRFDIACAAVQTPSHAMSPECGDLTRGQERPVASKGAIRDCNRFHFVVAVVHLGKRIRCTPVLYAVLLDRWIDRVGIVELDYDTG